MKAPACRTDQVSPPSVLCSRLPLCPTTQPLLASVNRTKNRPYAAPPVSFWIHVTPPSVVLRTMPAPPTAQPVVLLIKNMLLNAEVTPLVLCTQEMPFVVRRIRPLAPQAQACALSRA